MLLRQSRPFRLDRGRVRRSQFAEEIQQHLKKQQFEKEIVSNYNLNRKILKLYKISNVETNQIKKFKYITKCNEYKIFFRKFQPVSTTNFND
jgi:hypothetical protein